MDSQMKIGGVQGTHGSYLEAAKSAATAPEIIEKPPNMDILELGKNEDIEARQMEAMLERIRQFRFKDDKPKQKVKHKTGAIRGQILSSTTSMSARMALSEAYKEMASISVCTGSNGYDDKSATKAMAQIKKVIAVGKMKVSNLADEEQQELLIRRAKKRLESQEIRELNRELVQRRARNRKEEYRLSGGAENEGAENPFKGVKLPSASGAMEGSPMEGLPMEGLPIASLPTASSPAASLPTASLPVE